MKFILITFSFIFSIANGQGVASKTTISEVGKTGSIKVQKVTTITGNDTMIAYSITKNGGMFDVASGYMVALNPSEVPEVIAALKSFQPEVKKTKPENMTSLSYKTQDSTIVSCSYAKQLGWMIMIQNTNKQVEESLDKIQYKTGYQFNQFVQIDSFKLEAVIKLLSKIVEGN
jgi:hypothetical protein